MSDLDNPYANPETPIVPEAAQNSGVQLSVNMLQYLNDASPWLRFIGIVGYIVAGLTAFSGFMAFLSVLFAGAYFEEFSGGLGFIFLIYLPIGIVMFFPAHYAFNFGQKIHNYKFTNSIETLEEALKYNKSYWKFNGVLYIIYLSLIPVVLFGAIIAIVLAALGIIN